MSVGQESKYVSVTAHMNQKWTPYQPTPVSSVLTMSWFKVSQLQSAVTHWVNHLRFLSVNSSVSGALKPDPPVFEQWAEQTVWTRWMNWGAVLHKFWSTYSVHFLRIWRQPIYKWPPQTAERCLCATIFTLQMFGFPYMQLIKNYTVYLFKSCIKLV